jgi:putative oxidoreductase
MDMGDDNMDFGLLILRVVVGTTLAAHGAQKLFGWFGGPGLAGAGAGFEHLGFTPGRRHALMAGVVEVGGGLLLALGLATPLAAAVVASVMIVAAVSAHLPRGFFAQNGGYEYPLILGVAGLTLAFTGPGAISADAVLGWQVAGARWGALALAVAVIGAAGQLVQRRTAPAADHEPTAASA